MGRTHTLMDCAHVHVAIYDYRWTWVPIQAQGNTERKGGEGMHRFNILMSIRVLRLEQVLYDVVMQSHIPVFLYSDL